MGLALDLVVDTIPRAHAEGWGGSLCWVGWAVHPRQPLQMAPRTVKIAHLPPAGARRRRAAACRWRRIHQGGHSFSRTDSTSHNQWRATWCKAAVSPTMASAVAGRRSMADFERTKVPSLVLPRTARFVINMSTGAAVHPASIAGRARHLRCEYSLVAPEISG